MKHQKEADSRQIEGQRCLQPSANRASMSSMSPHKIDKSLSHGSAVEPLTTWVGRIFGPRRLAKIAVIVGLFTLLPYCLQRLPDLASRPEYRIETRRIQIDPKPEAPVPETLLEQVIDSTKLPHEFSILDGTMPAKLAQSIASHPWIATVVSVHQSFPTNVTVRVQYRKPVGMVHVNGGCFPIDATGMVLPPADFSSADLKRYPNIRGLSLPERMQPGNASKNPALFAAARLAGLLAPQWEKLQLESIVVTDHPDAKSHVPRITLELHSDNGSRIVWGRDPETQYPGELTPAQKVGRLESYLKEFGGFDLPNGPYEIDIRHWEEISRRPLGTRQSATGNSVRPRH
jgi:hypothetical protein